MRYQEYKNYLISNEWKHQKKRLAGFSKECWICGKRKKLQTHHRTYKNLGCEDITRDIFFLCPTHHLAIHDLAKKLNINIWNATNKFKKDYRKKKGFRWGKREIYDYWHTDKNIADLGM